MEEMMSRMEAGEDIEKLEEEYGDVCNEMDAGEGGAEPAERRQGAQGAVAQAAQASRARQDALRDERVCGLTVMEALNKSQRRSQAKHTKATKSEASRSRGAAAI